jgi:acetylornithine/succinyldiaminopimelate/putrescine aminotransferase
MLPGAVMAAYNDLEGAAKLIQKGKTAAVFVEPVQVGLCEGASEPSLGV